MTQRENRNLPPPEVTDQDLTDIIDKSGHRLLCDTNAFFLRHGWTTRLSQYYVDATTDKAREIDLIAEKVFEFGDRYQRDWVHFHVRLNIECKYVNAPVIFWMDPVDRDAVHRWVNSRTPFKTTNQYSNNLHYMSADWVAKLFASKKGSGEDTEPVFKALNQCIHGFANTRSQSLPIRQNFQRPSTRTLSLSYPVIVWSNFEYFYSTFVNESPPPQHVHENFMFEINYAYRNINGIVMPEYFLVDMVAFDLLASFLETIDYEVSAVKQIG
jgi:hypothetical protein